MDLKQLKELDVYDLIKQKGDMNNERMIRLGNWAKGKGEPSPTKSMHEMHLKQLKRIQDELSSMPNGYGNWDGPLSHFNDDNDDLKRNISSANYFIKRAIESLVYLDEKWDKWEV